MGRIHVLDDGLINRIAAGEVVERPASVVKELVENALDAGARSITVDLAAGGKRRIRVVDDGAGMDRDDALLALERHATSKLIAIDDLDAIGTLGFRGEALASIAAVSRFTMKTADRDGGGTEIEVRGGRIEAVREKGLPRGTSIDVERIFFNVPARRKFLKTDATELTHTARMLTRYALAHPGVRFRLTHGERELLRVDPADSALERVAQIYGREFAAKLLPFELDQPDLRVHGHAGRPADALPRRDGQYLFVNGRAVQDRVLQHAVTEAYANTMPRGRHPSLFLFVEVAPADVDVNVHPQKTEVRFRRSGQVHDATRDALLAALSHEAAVPGLADVRPSLAPSARPSPAYSARVSAALDRHLDRAQSPGPSTQPTGRTDSTVPANAAQPITRSDPELPGERFAELSEPRVVPLAQYRESYIVAQDDRGLVLVDQHAAHERILFEEYLADADRNEVEVQRLLFPLTLELASHEMLLLEEHGSEMRRIGFLVEPFGGNSVRLDGIPAVAAPLDPEGLFREILAVAAQARSAVSDSVALRHRLVTTAACKAAIKVNHRLTMEGMQALLDNLFRSVNPSTCPHGRPLLFRLDHLEIERAFDRR